MLSRCPCSVCWAAVGSDAMSKPRVPVAEIFGDMDARQVHYPTISTDMLEQVPAGCSYSIANHKGSSRHKHE